MQVSSCPLAGLPRRGLRPMATRWWPVYSARWSSARYTCDSAGSMASIWLARRRCSASGSDRPASSPRRCRQVRSDGSRVSPASAPASAAVRCLACSSVSAPRVNDIWVHTRMPRSPAPAPAALPVPAAEAPVPALSSPPAPIRSAKACTSIAPAYRQATVPDSIRVATRQLAPSPSPSAPARSSPADWPSVPAPSPLPPVSCSPSPTVVLSVVPGRCPGAVSSPSPAAGPAAVASVTSASSNRGPGAGSVPCCLISSEIRDRGTAPAQPVPDLGVGEALPCPLAGLPQPGGTEDRRAAHLAGQSARAVLAVAGADPRYLGGLDAERGGDGPALEAAALGERADDQVPHLQVAGAEG